LKFTTPYPHKYKTVLCKFWTKGLKCPFGSECNYAHGAAQLAEKTTNANGDSQSAFSDVPKKSPSSEARPKMSADDASKSCAQGD